MPWTSTVTSLHCNSYTILQCSRVKHVRLLCCWYHLIKIMTSFVDNFYFFILHGKGNITLLLLASIQQHWAALLRRFPTLNK